MCEHHDDPRSIPEILQDMELVVSNFLTNLKTLGILEPCSHCGFPAVKTRRMSDGHLFCSDCHDEMLIEEANKNG